MELLLAVLLVVMVILIVKISNSCAKEMFGGNVSRVVSVESCPEGMIYTAGLCKPALEARLRPSVDNLTHIDRVKENFSGGSPGLTVKDSCPCNSSDVKMGGTCLSKINQ